MEPLGESSPNQPSVFDNRVVRTTARLLGGVAAFLLFCMMALTFFDVLGRYFFNSPIPGSFEITELMLATLIFAGLPLVTAHKEQVTVDLFDRFIPLGWQGIRDFIIYLTSGVLTLILGYLVFRKALEIQEYGDVTAMLYIPIAPMVYFMSVALVLTGLVFIALAWQALRNSDAP